MSAGGLRTAMRPKSSSFLQTQTSAKGTRTFNCFVVTKDMGIQIVKEQKLGIRASSTCTISFNGLRIPEENVIGGIGKDTRLPSRFSTKVESGSPDRCSDLRKERSTSRFRIHMSESSSVNPLGTFRGCSSRSRKQRSRLRLHAS